jgi:hypothetical protein
MLTCYFCKTDICSPSSLANHQKTAAYCLKLQGKEPPNGKEYLKKILEEKNKEIEDLKFKIIEKDIIIAKLEVYKDMYNFNNSSWV